MASAATVAMADSTAAVCLVICVDSDIENLTWGDFHSRMVTVLAQTSPQTGYSASAAIHVHRRAIHWMT